MPPAPFHGMQEDESGRPLPIEIRLAVFDSEVAKLANHWSDEVEAEVVEWLRSNPRYGVDFVEVVPAPVGKPWPGYDGVDDPDRIIEIAGDIEADLNAVLRYEKENAKRDWVIAALEREIESLDEAEIVVSA